MTNLKFQRVTSEISFRFIKKNLKTSDKQLSCSFVNSVDPFADKVKSE